MKRVGKIQESYFEEKNDFVPSAEDRARSYTLFTKSSGEDLFPNSLPAKYTLVKEYSAYGVKGSFAPLQICILPQSDLTGVSVSVSDLKNEKGAVITRENISIKHVKYEYMQVGEFWMLKGRYLLDGSVDIPAGVTRAFLLTIKIPEDALPGIYKGKAKLLPEQTGRRRRSLLKCCRLNGPNSRLYNTPEKLYHF